MLYKRNPMIKEQIDSLPLNNPCVHDMAPLLCESISDEEFNSMTKDTFLFKLSYKKYTSDIILKNPNNLYYRIKSGL